MNRVAIVGAGLAGLTLAAELRGRAAVTVYEKSSGPGGRMATRYTPPYEFDHGAQFFTARSPAFFEAVSRWRDAGIVAPWYARFAELDRTRVVSSRTWDDEYPHFVAVPRMNQLGKHLAATADVRLGSTISHLSRTTTGWQLMGTDDVSLGEFDWVISTAPAAQTAGLLPDEFAHAEQLRSAQMRGCYALMLGFATPPRLDWDAALVHDADISWVSVNSSKPGRPDGFAVLVHSTNAFAEAHMGDDSQDVTAHLISELRDVTGIDASKAESVQLHRWRYANIEKQDGTAPLVDGELRLAACGDWCIRGRIEAAFVSAMKLAEALRGPLP